MPKYLRRNPTIAPCGSAPTTTGMPEYQMSHASTKAIAAAQIAATSDDARPDHTCGSITDPGRAMIKHVFWSAAPSTTDEPCCVAEDDRAGGRRIRRTGSA